MSAHILGGCAILIGVVAASIPIIIYLLRGENPSRYAITNTASETRAERKKSKCDICDSNMEMFGTTYTLPCKHKFHRKCLQMVFEAQLKNSTTCPYIDCRRWVRPEIRNDILSEESSS